MNTILEEYESHVQNERWEEACELAYQLTQVVPDESTSWFNLGVCLDETKQHMKAAKAFQQALVLSPEDNEGIFRMLRSFLLAERLDALYEELRTYAYQSLEIIQEIAALDTFEKLFQTDDRFISLLKGERLEGVSEKHHTRSLAFLGELGFSVPEQQERMVCRNYFRFMPEIGLRTLALKCVYLYLTDDIEDQKIDDCLDANQLRHYLAEDEQSMLAIPRSQAREEYSHIAGWFAERLLPLACILGYPAFSNPLSSLSEEAMNDLMIYIGDLVVIDDIWDWMARFKEPLALENAVNLENLHYQAHVAVQYARAGQTKCVPENFDPVLDGGVILERWGSLMWALTPELGLDVQIF